MRSRLLKITPLIFSAVLVLQPLAQTQASINKSARKGGESCDSQLTSLTLDRDAVLTQISQAKKQLDGGSDEEQELRARLQKSGAKGMVDEDLVKSLRNLYFKTVKTAKIDDQKQSGDCWVFAVLAAISDHLYQQGLVPKGFEFSETYVYYFTNVLKVDSYFNHIIGAANQLAQAGAPLAAGPTLKEYLSLISDGGYETWMLQAIALFGLVPKAMMKATYSAQDTAFIQSELQGYSAKMAKEMIDLTAKLKHQNLSEKEILVRLIEFKTQKFIGVHQILMAHLGTPYGSGFTDLAQGSEPGSAGKIKIAERVNNRNTGRMLEFKDALDFNKNFVKFKPDDFISVTQVPNIPSGHFYEIPYTSMDDGFSGASKYNISFLNVAQKRFNDLIDSAVIDREVPVPFSSDVVHNVSGNGFADPNIFLRNEAYGFAGRQALTPLSPKDALWLGSTSVDHEMAFIGTAKPGKGKTRFDRNAPTVARLIRNSWGAHYGLKPFRGDVVASAGWINRQAFSILIHKSLLSSTERRMLENPQPVTSDMTQIFGPFRTTGESGGVSGNRQMTGTASRR